MSRRPAERRTQHAVMATASEWARIRELAADAGMDISRYIVHRATVPDPLPDTVLRRAVRELLLLARIEEQRMADMGLEDRWKALGDAVDAWLDREAELDRLTDPGAAERWRAVSGRLTRCGRFTGRDGGAAAGGSTDGGTGRAPAGRPCRGPVFARARDAAGVSHEVV